MSSFDWMCEYEDRWLDNGRLRPEFRERRLNMASGHGAAVVAWLEDQFGRQCAFCGSTNDLQVDHIRPIARGGSNRLFNLQLLCQPCNLQKGAR